jgi:hypothetical protein
VCAGDDSLDVVVDRAGFTDSGHAGQRSFCGLDEVKRGDGISSALDSHAKDADQQVGSPAGPGRGLVSVGDQRSGACLVAQGDLTLGQTFQCDVSGAFGTVHGGDCVGTAQVVACLTQFTGHEKRFAEDELREPAS